MAQDHEDTYKLITNATILKPVQFAPTLWSLSAHEWLSSVVTVGWQLLQMDTF